MCGQCWVSFPFGLKCNLQLSCCSVILESGYPEHQKLGNNKEQNVYNKKVEDQPGPFLETNALLSSCQRVHKRMRYYLSSVAPQSVLLALGALEELLLGTGSGGEAQIGMFLSEVYSYCFWSLCEVSEVCLPFLNQSSPWWYQVWQHLVSRASTAQPWLAAQRGWRSAAVLLTPVAALSWNHWLYRVLTQLTVIRTSYSSFLRNKLIVLLPYWQILVPLQVN